MGLGGTVGGSFFKAAEWVDHKKPPGHTSMTSFVDWRNSVKEVCMLRNILFSPNLVWMVIALVFYVAFPYDIPAAREFAAEWVLRRLGVNVLMFASYYGFWSLALNVLGMASRKYKPRHVPTTARMFHNIWYCVLGALQIGVWEIFFLHLWATGKVGYTPEAAASWYTLVGWTLALPVLHDVHFYFIHRMIHIRPLYRFVHSLHHRNNDTEPFCGIAMHPVEHMYFFSGLGLSFYFGTLWCPWHFYWSLSWLLLAPGASHSGWEDHFNADQFHYMHHAKFECNYGSPGFPMDKIFGTMRTCLDPDEKTYSSGATEEDLNAAAKESGQRVAGRGGSVKPARAPVLTFSKGTIVTVKDDFMSNDHKKRALKQGMRGTVKQTNGDGDACIRFDGVAEDTWVFVSSFDKLGTSSGTTFRDFMMVAKTPSSPAAKKRAAAAAAAPLRRWSSGGGLSIFWAFPEKAEQWVYWSFICAGFALLYSAVVQLPALDPIAAAVRGQGLSLAQVVAFVVAAGPVVWGVLLQVVCGDSMSWRWPFHKEGVLAFGCHFLAGAVCAVVPTYHVIEAVLSEPIAQLAQGK